MAAGDATTIPFPPGVRMTPQRRAVVDALVPLAGRFTVSDLHERARRLHPQLGLATTYRALELLRQAGSVRRLSGDVPTYVRCRPGHHHHLVCVSCGDVQETELCAAPPASVLRERYGFVPAAHDLDIYGHCAVCAG